MEFLYPKLDLNQLDIFKVVKDGQLVDEEDVAPMKDTQDPKGNTSSPVHAKERVGDKEEQH